MKHSTRLVVIAAISSLLFTYKNKTQLLMPQPSSNTNAPNTNPPQQHNTNTNTNPSTNKYIKLPYHTPPNKLNMSFTTRIQSTNIYFLINITNNMNNKIIQIHQKLHNKIIPKLTTEIPKIRFNVTHFTNFPLPNLNYNNPSNKLYHLLLPSSNNITTVQRTVDILPLKDSRDGPETLVEALYLSATKAGIGRFVPPTSCPADTVSYPCFHTNGSRIVLAFTDAPTHEGPGGHDTYMDVRPEPHEYDVTVATLHMIGAKVLGLYSGDLGGTGEADLDALAHDTGAVREDGSPIVFEIGTGGELLGSSVVEAVHALVEEVPIDVDVVLEDAPGDAIDATAFVERVVADHAEPTSGAVAMDDRFDGVRPGTRVFFRILLANDRIEETDVPQSFLLRVVLRGDGATHLSETLVRIVVPALSGAGCDAF